MHNTVQNQRDFCYPSPFHSFLHTDLMPVYRFTKKKKNCYFPAFKILWVLMRSELLRLAHRGPHNQTSLCLPGHITSSCILLSATLKSLFPWSSQALLQSAIALKGVCLSLAWIPVCKQLKCHLSSLISPQGRQLLCLWFQSHIHTS